MELHLLHTNDVHSHLEEYLRIATQIRQLRNRLEDQGQTVFLFDLGDHADRMRPETDATMGLINASLLKNMQYDAWVFGNNEGLIIPRRFWQDLCAESGTTVLGSNLRDLKTGQPLPYFEDKRIIERGGIKVGLIGVTAPYNDYYQMEGIWALHPEDQIASLTKELQSQGADIVILLSHLGLAVDRKIAEKALGVDVILGSHTHHLLERPERVGDVWIAQAGKFANYYGHVILDYDESKRCLRNVTGSVIARDDKIEVEADLLETMEDWGHRADQVLDHVIAQVPANLEHHVAEESELANLVADEMLAISEAELALLNTGVFMFGMDEGPLTRRTLLACCPSPINPVLVKLQGRQILTMLNGALNSELIYRRGIGFGFRGKEIGSLAVAGGTVEHQNGHIKQVIIQGVPLDEQKVYRVVTADYLYFSGVYGEIPESDKIRFEPHFLRELMERAVIEPEKIQRAKTKRWLEGVMK